VISITLTAAGLMQILRGRAELPPVGPAKPPVPGREISEDFHDR
jgi:hypothetical protein